MKSVGLWIWCRKVHGSLEEHDREERGNKLVFSSPAPFGCTETPHGGRTGFNQGWGLTQEVQHDGEVYVSIFPADTSPGAALKIFCSCG